MFTKIKQFFLGKPVPAVPAPYKVEAPQETHVEVAPATAPIVAEPAPAEQKTVAKPKKPAAKKAAPAAKKPAAAKPAARKPAAKKSV